VQRTAGVADAARLHYVTACRRRGQGEPVGPDDAL